MSVVFTNMSRFTLLCAVSTLWSLLSCGGSAECVNEIATSDYNTSGLQCTQSCDCSNLKYEGYCVGGICISTPRTPAQRKGETRPCKFLQKIGECMWGQQEAQPSPLKDLVWGDCKAKDIGLDIQENTKERCFDGLDNDCDGRIDLGDPDCKTFCLPGQTAPCYTDDPQTLNVGLCRSGLKSCKDDNTWGECTGEKKPTSEVCNKQDDNCDGQIDEGLSGCEVQTCLGGQQRSCYPEPIGCKTENDAQGLPSFRCQGICHAGLQTCQQGRWGNCEMFVPPANEACDGIDNDCDGIVDEGCPCEQGKEQPCFLGPEAKEVGECKAGTQLCNNGTWSECKGAVLPSTETCDGKDNDCNGKIDDFCVCTKDNDCPQGLVCLEGICQKSTCPSGQTLCTRTCINTKSSNDHCGACGKKCSGGKSCVDGLCSCPTGQTDCNGICKDTQSDRQHCGACDKTCPSAEYCDAGTCRSTCSPPTTACGDACADTQTSPLHCGACNNVCASPRSCSSGQCNCPTSQTFCGGICVDIQSNNRHCGKCEHACSATETCQAGVCQSTCPLPKNLCNGDCIDPESDRTHCGKCNNPCPLEKNCQKGACVCPNPLTDCFGDCVNLQSSNLNCGSCGMTCGSPRVCQGGQCTCPNGTTFCNGDCVDLQTNLSHCGTCGTACSNGNTCQAGICKCPSGQANCSGQCADLDTSREHCGACDSLCPTNATACQNGQCICPPNTSICSLSCVNHQTDDRHCGACNRRCPTFVCVAGNCLQATQMSVGDNHLCAVVNDGTARCWGSNGNGKLGHGTSQPTIPNTAKTAVVQLSNPKQISAGSTHTCAVLQNNTVRCWGNNGNGQLGDNSKTPSPSPVLVSILNVKQVSAGATHTCAVLNSGTAECWGSGQSGQLGDGSNQERLSPTEVSGLTTIQQISAGSSHTCAVLNDNTARCWGYGFYGQLGNGLNQSSSTPTPVLTLTGIQQISAGCDHTCAVLNDGTARCWGRNEYGQLGDNTKQANTSPTSVSGLSNVKQISAGCYHTCAVLNDGTARCWGRNEHGQLGDGTIQDKLIPTTVSGLSGAKEISTGKGLQISDRSTCAILDNGAAQCWGNGSLGQLGNGTYTTPQTTPVYVIWK